jgi:hypothetical protein
MGDNQCADVDVLEFLGDITSFVTVPAAGHEMAKGKDDMDPQFRVVPNGCAICLSVFKPNDRVTWVSDYYLVQVTV